MICHCLLPDVMQIANLGNLLINFGRAENVIDSKPVFRTAFPAELLGSGVPTAPGVDDASILQCVKTVCAMKSLADLIDEVSTSVEVAQKQRTIPQFKQQLSDKMFKDNTLFFFLGKVNPDQIYIAKGGHYQPMRMFAKVGVLAVGNEGDFCGQKSTIFGRIERA